MRTMFEAKMNMQSSSKASSCQNASFNYVQVMSLSTILVVLILMLMISIIPIIRSEIIVMIICAIGCKSKPKLKSNKQAYNLDNNGFAHNTAKPFFIS